MGSIINPKSLLSMPLGFWRSTKLLMITLQMSARIERRVKGRYIAPARE
jgi:hypothetical protein